MLVDLVRVQTCDGLLLDGSLRKPSRDRRPQLGIDIAILFHGVGGNFYNTTMFEGYSEALLERGCAVLRVNNRGHDPIMRLLNDEPSERYGAAYEVVDECRYDWRAWARIRQDLSPAGRIA